MLRCLHLVKLMLTPSLPPSLLPSFPPYPSVRGIPSETYLCSISIPDCPTPYISCIVTTTTAADGRGREEKLRVCTGGNELKVWDVTPVQKLPDTEG